MNQLLIHSTTETDLNDFIKSPSQVLILSGPTGIGKSAVASYVARRVLGLDEHGYDIYPYKLIIGEAADEEFGIVKVRSIEHFLSLKIPSLKSFNRVLLINRAEDLSIEAQNALLKTLEEPPIGTLIILSASHSQSILPTIRSRATLIALHRPTKRQLEVWFMKRGFDKPAIGRAYVMAAGLPGLMTAILESSQHQLLAATSLARELLSLNVFERLQKVDELSKDRELARQVCFIIQQMAHVSLLSSDRNSAKWQQVLKSSYQTEVALSQRVQPKLALTDLVLSL